MADDTMDDMNMGDLTMSEGDLDIVQNFEGSIITDGETDIAYNTRGDTMRVQQPQRRTFNTVYLWKPGLAAERTYQPDKDAKVPSAAQISEESTKPSSPTENAEPYLVVGLVIAQKPKFCTEDSGSGRGSKASQKLKASDHGVLRVVAPVTERIASQAKLYVACSPLGGRCYAKSVSTPCVFFFQEIWKELSDEEKRSVKNRGRAIGPLICRLAATNKTTASVAVAVTENAFTKAKNDNPLAQSRLENLAQHLLMNFSVHRLESQNSQVIKQMLHLVSTAGPDLKFGPSTSDAAVNEFLSDQEDYTYTQQSAQQLARLLQDKIPNIQPADIMETRRILAEGGYLQQVDEGHLSFLLHTCTVLDDGQINDRVVSQALKMLQVHQQHAKPTRVATNTRLSAGNTSTALEILLLGLEGLRKYIVNTNTSLMEHYGALLKYTSLEEVMKVLKDAVDVDVCKSLHQQIAALQAAQLSAANMPVIEELDRLMEYLNEVIPASSNDTVDESG